MPSSAHTFGPRCRLAPVPRPPSAIDSDDFPPIAAQFFYSSLVPIDDPLAPGTIAGATEGKTAKAPLRPFSLGDNNTLEKAWLGLASDEARHSHRLARQKKRPDPVASNANLEKRIWLVRRLAHKHWEKHGEEYHPRDLAPPPGTDDLAAGTPLLVCCPELYVDAASDLKNNFCALLRKRDHALTAENIVQESMMELRRLRSTSAATATAHPRSGSGSGVSPEPADAHNSMRPRSNTRETKDIQVLSRPKAGSVSRVTDRSSRPVTPAGMSAPPRPPPADDGISGMPFVRVGTPSSLDSPTTGSNPPTEPVAKTIAVSEPLEDFQSLGDDGIKSGQTPLDASEISRFEGDSVDVAVGISRLHMVSFPTMQMRPIYWSPLNDIAVVSRATWFYRDNMLPVDPVIANLLEAGYRELRPYSQTWNDELRCAVEVGPLGEEKVSYRLWGSELEQTIKDKDGLTDPAASIDPFCAAHCFGGEAAAVGSIESILGSAGSPPSTAVEHRSYSSYDVVYKDKNTAFLLKPTLKASAYYGRRPVAKIMKGITIGIPVVRGFDRDAWDHLYGRQTQPRGPSPAMTTTEPLENAQQGLCIACQEEKERGQVTDLVLVIHGIGQKFAEKVESFHFTHAINAFRRAVNIELDTNLVKSVLREGQNGIMVLPVNWRHTLSFVDGDPASTVEGGGVSQAQRAFVLKDIEPDSIPAVRSMISDIMFDVPFYMSHHKAKMIEGLVAEANRVYRLWCRNNPGFAKAGRVHIIGHSLGSAMALDVLSRQPSYVPELDLDGKLPQTTMFEFDTTNLFLAGSPAGFFLLLERGGLVPRRGRLKPGADPADVAAKDVTSEAGHFGCIAVDNIYNILAKEDPIAYFLNGTVDPGYAASLKVAYVPSTATSIFKSVSETIKGFVPGLGAGSTSASATLISNTESSKPPAVRLPSQLELEVHDFTREEIAERKAYLLNDNGQIDYYLRSGGGPLEIQYLNMLSAHSSYWTNQDFIRMLCMEIGRKPGRQNTLPVMRAVKATKRLLPHIS